jgi:phosphopantothenoylcysteine decarboxylase / phosphopantothenate---cysteine ligase
MRSQKQSRRLNLLITAGGTREYIDPVRFISNASSGRMGYDIAWAGVFAGHKVTLITTVPHLPAPMGVKPVKAISANDMFEAVKELFGKCDCLIMAAAVSDYTPVSTARLKIKRGDEDITLKLKPTTDILKWAGVHKRRNQLVVGFALEDRNVRTNAEKKLREKKLDMIIANRPKVIGKSKASVEIKNPKGRWISIRQTPKSVIAQKIIRLIERIRFK